MEINLSKSNFSLEEELFFFLTAVKFSPFCTRVTEITECLSGDYKCRTIVLSYLTFDVKEIDAKFDTHTYIYISISMPPVPVVKSVIA